MVCRLPKLSVRLSVNGVWANESDNKRQSKSVDLAQNTPRHLQPWLCVHADQEYVLQINASRFSVGNRVCIAQSSYIFISYYLVFFYIYVSWLGAE